ncbi:MAG: hypothetical protein WKF68_03510 [Daejeonella sp.]
MKDEEKIKAAIAMLKRLKRMVGFFMKRDISELIEKLESKDELNIPASQVSKNIPV